MEKRIISRSSMGKKSKKGRLMLDASFSSHFFKDGLLLYEALCRGKVCL
jgi:hypothetical protein